jgi:hypothetical protein
MIESPKCFERGCRYFLGVYQPNDFEEGEFPFCAAFPDGIPDEIAYGENLHLEKYPGQKNDFTFEK